MLYCEGYMMFKGRAWVVPIGGTMPPFEVEGTWLYKPEWNCWYVNGHSYPAEIVDISNREEDE